MSAGPNYYQPQYRPPQRSNYTALYIVLAIMTPFAGLFLFCCVCGPMLSLFVETPLERADSLWEEGKKKEAVEVYASEINGSSPNATALKRSIEYYFEAGDTGQVQALCERAVKAKADLTLSPQELRNIYDAAKTKIENEEKVARQAEEQAKEAEAQEDARRASESELADDKIEAWTMAEQFVTDMVKSPSTADFGSVFGEYQDPRECVEALGDGEYRVTGWVDAQNGFGATVRTDFVLTLRNLPDSDKWQLVGEPLMVQR